MKANVKRGSLTNNFALALKYGRDIDIIMIQELQISHELDKKLCKKYREYQAYAPKDK